MDRTGRRAVAVDSPVVWPVKAAGDATLSTAPLGREGSRRVSPGGREFGARAVVVDAIDDQAAAFYRHFDFHQLDDRRLWRRLADVARAVGE